MRVHVVRRKGLRETLHNNTQNGKPIAPKVFQDFAEVILKSVMHCLGHWHVYDTTQTVNENGKLLEFPRHD